MAWQNPKVDWDINPKNPKSEDLNRIEANIEFLKGDIELKKGEIVTAINSMGQSTTIGDTHTTLATKIKAISTDANAVVGDVLSGKTFYQGGTKKTGTIPSKGVATITPSTVNQTIASGQYIGGTQTIAGDADLVTGNIRAGVNIFGVVGKASVVETSDATIIAGDVLSGKTGYKNGAKITGTIPSKTAQTFTPSTVNQTIPVGQYLSGIQTILGDADLIAANILSGKNIFGVVGSAIDGAGMKKFASGNVSIPSQSNYVISGLAFQPKIIIAYVNQYIFSSNNVNTVCIYVNGMTTLSNINVGMRAISNGGRFDLNAITASTSSFTINLSTFQYLYTGTYPVGLYWIAIGD